LQIDTRGQILPAMLGLLRLRAIGASYKQETTKEKTH
jgi:hypothetical protein